MSLLRGTDGFHCVLERSLDNVRARMGLLSAAASLPAQVGL